MYPMTLKSKLALMTTLTIVLLSGALTTISNIDVTNAIKHRLYHSEVPTTLYAISKTISAALEGPISVADSMAKNPDYLDLYQNNSLSSESDRVIRYLTAVEEQDGIFTSFMISAETGEYFNNQGFVKNLNAKNEADQWFYRFLNSNDRFELSIDYNQHLSSMVLFVNFKIMDGAKAVGVTGIGIALRDLTNVIQNFKVGESGNVFLVDVQGVIQLHKDTSQRGQSINDLYEISSGDVLNQNSLTILETHKQHSDVLLASEYMEMMGFYAVFEMSRDEIFSDSRSLALRMILVTSVLIVVFSILASIFISNLVAPIKEIGNRLEDIASGGADLTQRLEIHSNDEVGQLAANYNQFVSSLSDILRQVKTSCEELLDNVSVLSNQVATVHEDVSEQTAQTQSAAAAIHELGHTVNDIAANASKTAQTVSNAGADVNQGHESVVKTIDYVQAVKDEMEQATHVMSKLAAESETISTVLDVIREISEQTNLLALNAAIEAARAGEQGRGFAVVADEVRSLAKRSHDSTVEIQAIIEKLQAYSAQSESAIREGSSATQMLMAQTQSAGNNLEKIRTATTGIDDMTVQIATATEQQSSVITEVNSTIEGIATIASINADAVTQTKQGCERLKSQVRNLEELISTFKI